jgi:outer membrane protein assembly factor BamD
VAAVRPAHAPSPLATDLPAPRPAGRHPRARWSCRGRRASGLLLVLGLIAGFAGVSGCGGVRIGAAGVAPKVLASGREPREIYEHGQRMLERRAYDKAISDFQELRNFHRDDPLSVKAQLALAEVRFLKGELEEARYAFEEFAQYHPRHPDLDLVTYRIGQCIWRRAPKLAGRDQTTTRSAVNTWWGFDNRFPDSEYAADVGDLLQRGLDRLAAKELWIARFYRRRSAWTAVDGRVRELVRRYADSNHVEGALALLAESLHHRGLAADAADVRQRVAEQFGEDALSLRWIDRALASPLQPEPEEATFKRPYRLSGVPQPGAVAP